MTTKVTHGVTQYTAGQVIQSVYSEYLASTLLTTAFPSDDTIPQSNEGTEIMTASITPKLATSYLRVRFTCFASNANDGGNVAAALFRDAAADAVSAASTNVPGAGGRGALCLEHQEVAGSTSQTTFKIRLGASAGNTQVNGGTVAGRLFGGKAKSVMVIEEIAV